MLLTVAIPSLNGERFLMETLVSAASQVEQLVDVEILVVDNASTDRTSQVVQEAQRLYPFIRLVRNSETLPVNQNIHEAVSRASGEYVWILADDDVVAAGGIDQVLKKLELFAPSVLLVGFENVDEELNIIKHLSAKDSDLLVLDVSGKNKITISECGRLSSLQQRRGIS